MTQEADNSGDAESRLRDLQVLADEGLITPEEHQEHRRRLQGEVRRSAEGRGRSQAETAPTEAMHGNAVTLLDELIGMWSRWDANERYYLEELVPRIVRSDDPDFAWMNTEEERVVTTRLRALMSPEEWRILPELIRARRSLGLHELDSDKGRPERLAAQRRPRREKERKRVVVEEWAEAFERARQEGEERIRNEQEAQRARLEREAEERSREEHEQQPARGRRRRPRRTGQRSAAEPDSTADRSRDSSEPSADTQAEAGPTEPVSVQPAELESAPVPADEGTERAMSDEPAPADAEVTGPPEANAPEGEQVATNTESEDAASNPPARAGQRDALVPDGVALDLRGFAGRLRGAGERPLADAVSDYADRVRAVRRGELSPALSAAPAAVTPEMVGAAIARSRIELFVEVVRNVLIFMPVLWTWLKLQAAVSAYGRESPEQLTFFDFWVRQGGGGGPWGGTLADAARHVALILVLLITVNVLLGLLRGHTASRRAGVERHFAATLARAEAAGAAQRSADPQVALEGFVHASHDLTANLRSVSELLEASVSPFAEAQEAAALSAEALAGIRDSLAPSARDFAGAAATLERLAEQLERMTENMAGAVANLESGLDSSASDLREAASSMRTVATRVLDELGDGPGQATVNDESIAIAGWLLADLVLVLALLFLALTPGRDAIATTIAAPVILDIGCVLSASDEEISVSCTPQIDGGMASAFQWAAERGAPVGPSDAATFEASFEGAGAVGLTVSNDGGMHRAAFPVLPSPAATPAEKPIAAPLILDIGCVADTSDGQTNVTCTPQLGGDAPSSYEWTAERGLARSHESSSTFAASFPDAGAVWLVVANGRGEDRAAFPVLPGATPLAVVELASADVLTDFRFDQIVLRDVQLGEADWKDIAGGKVRAGLIKSQEDESLGREWWSAPSTQPEPADFLRAKLEQGLRIALVETFSHEPGGAHRSLSRQVNDTFYEGLLRELYGGEDSVGVHNFFVDCDARTKWFVDYRDTTFDEDEVRINIFFVRPSDTAKICQ